MDQPPQDYGSYPDAYRAVLQHLFALGRVVAYLSEKDGPGDPSAPPPGSVDSYAPNPVVLRDGVRVLDALFDDQVAAADADGAKLQPPLAATPPTEGVLLRDVFRSGQYPASVVKFVIAIATQNDAGDLQLPFSSIEEAKRFVAEMIARK